ncbi:MAG: Gfo/Idh/MocA family oxidoreductase [Phycisphaeraceae bacterium]|jgi:predicted dehydrogenase|nr:Gfo/Idh/MocA family oxidoreductase [Phycisphaeraceae bacterium]
MSKKTQYALVGTGGRALMYIDALVDKYSDNNELVGLCDVSQVRMDWYNGQIKDRWGAEPVPTYHADDFDKMVAECKPDTVIVTTADFMHHHYIIRSMELGCNAITEKPMTIDGEKASAIFEAIERTGRNLRVTFNYRYAPHVTQVCRMLRDGVVGTPLSVDFSWVLDTRHGADYFRRWHSYKDKSGGLLVHKATHHFDMINWWIDSYPKTVYCIGDRMFYGAENAAKRGEVYNYDRYTDVDEAKDDPFYLSLSEDERLTALYLNAEKDSGYVRDQNVFRDDITIEDTMAVTARYRNGVILNYSLIAYSPWEGYRVSVTGTKGRIELFDGHGSHIIKGQSDEEIAEAQAANHRQELMVYPMFAVPYGVEPAKGEGGHAGGDTRLLDDLLLPDPSDDPLKTAATHIDGAASILMGVCANESIRTGQPIDVDSVLKLPQKQSVMV